MNRILLADDHEVMRSGLKLLLSGMLSLPVIDEAWDETSVMEKVMQNDYDLIMLDVYMPSTDSCTLLKNILMFKPRTKVLMFSMNAEELYAKRYLKLGAMGYLRKDESEGEIRKAVNTVLSNKTYVSQGLKERFVFDLKNDNSPANPFDSLTSREFEMVQHLCRGESLASICQKLKIHSSTAGTHKAHIFKKLLCDNVVDLSKLARLHNVFQ